MRYVMSNLLSLAAKRPHKNVIDTFKSASTAWDTDWYEMDPETHKKLIKSTVWGAGDLVSAITSAVGIKPCGGCNKRKLALNELIPDIKHPFANKKA